MDSSENSELIFTVRQSAVHLTSEETEGEERENNNENTFNQETKILAMVWKSGKMGAAYFNSNEKSLRVYEEVSETGPLFFLTSSVYREVAPLYLITVGKLSDEYIKHLIETVSCINDATATTDTIRSLPANMFLLSPKEYSFEICRSVLSELNLASVEGMPEAEKELYIHSLLNFDYKMSIYAAGVLVKYLDKNWAHFISSRHDLEYLTVSQVSLYIYFMILKGGKHFYRKLNTGGGSSAETKK